MLRRGRWAALIVALGVLAAVQDAPATEEAVELTAVTAIDGALEAPELAPVIPSTEVAPEVAAVAHATKATYTLADLGVIEQVVDQKPGTRWYRFADRPLRSDPLLGYASG